MCSLCSWQTLFLLLTPFVSCIPYAPKFPDLVAGCYSCLLPREEAPSTSHWTWRDLVGFLGQEHAINKQIQGSPATCWACAVPLWRGRLSSSAALPSCAGGLEGPGRGGGIATCSLLLQASSPPCIRHREGRIQRSVAIAGQEPGLTVWGRAVPHCGISPRSLHVSAWLHLAGGPAFRPSCPLSGTLDHGLWEI